MASNNDPEARGPKPRMSEAQLEKAVAGLIRKGFTSKSSIDKELRAQGRGASHARVLPIAERLLAEEEAKAEAKAKASRPRGQARKAS